MPITLETLRASLTAVGASRRLAAHRSPYVTDPRFGFDHSARNAGSALLASVIVYHEGPDMAFAPVTEDELRETRTALNTAKAAFDTARAATEGGQGVQAPVAQGALVAARKAHQENEYRKMIADNITGGAASTTYIDVVGCQQVRKLSDQNIANYFIMMGIVDTDVPDDLGSYAAYWARSTAGIADLREFQERITGIEWVYYHTNASQNGPLVLQAAMSLPKAENGSSYFTAAELQAAREHNADTKSMEKARNIPKTALIKTYAILEASSSLPEKKWYMGLKAKELYPAIQYTLIVQGLKQYNAAIKETLLPSDETDPGVIANNINKLVANMNREDTENPENVEGQLDGGQDDQDGNGLGGNDGDDGNDGGNGGHGVDHEGWPYMHGGNGNDGNENEEGGESGGEGNGGDGNSSGDDSDDSDDRGNRGNRNPNAGDGNIGNNRDNENTQDFAEESEEELEPGAERIDYVFGPDGRQQAAVGDNTEDTGLESGQVEEDPAGPANQDTSERQEHTSAKASTAASKKRKGPPAAAPLRVSTRKKG